MGQDVDYRSARLAKHEAPDSPLLVAEGIGDLEALLYTRSRSSSLHSHSPVHVGRREDTAKGNRPSFGRAAPPEQAEPLYETFCAVLEGEGIEVARGRFGARMTVEIANDRPVTVVLDT